MTKNLIAAASLVGALTLVACTGDGDHMGSGPEPAATQSQNGDERLTGMDIHEDPERFSETADEWREEFNALAQTNGPEPVVLGLNVCSVLYAEHDNNRDVAATRDELVDRFPGEGYLSNSTGEHWVDRSVAELCSELDVEG